MFYLGGALILFGGAAVVIRAAEIRGRNAPVWGVAAILLAAAAAWAAEEYVTGQVIAGEEPGYTAGLSLVLAPIAVHVVLTTLAVKLPAPAGRTRASHWPMARMDADQQPCVLRLRDDALVIESETAPIELPYHVLSSARGDGECLRIHWLDGGDEHSLLLMPVGGPRTREGRVRLLIAIGRRIHERMTRR